MDETLIKEPKPSAARYIPLAWALIVLLAILAFWLNLRDPVIASRWNLLWDRSEPSKGQALDPTALELKDSALGTELPLTGPGKQVRKYALSRPHGALLVWLGTCGSCTKFDHRSWQVDADKRGTILIGISSTSEVEAEKYRQEADFKGPIVSDPSSDFARSINLYYGGRVMYYDHYGKLKWKMSGFAQSGKMAEFADLVSLMKR